MTYHVISIQASSVLAFIISFIALILIWRALKRFSPGFIQKSTRHLLFKLVLLTIATLNLALYHLWNTRFSIELWHIFAGLAMAMGAYAAVYLANVSRKIA